ncbi:hypothetical protein [Streptomyces sp. NPDC002889]|uniref:hypothetical protein n=1 Tax=Streptomyces sp. NPDC002889 TaxID=3364669 RepID=UPI0036CC9C34
MLQLIQDRECDALSLGLPDIARALVCSGPHSEVRAYDPAAERYQAYGPADRIDVLVEVGSPRPPRRATVMAARLLLAHGLVVAILGRPGRRPPRR